MSSVPINDFWLWQPLKICIWWEFLNHAISPSSNDFRSTICVSLFTKMFPWCLSNAVAAHDFKHEDSLPNFWFNLYSSLDSSWNPKYWCWIHFYRFSGGWCLVLALLPFVSSHLSPDVIGQGRMNTGNICYVILFNNLDYPSALLIATLTWDSSHRNAYEKKRNPRNYIYMG